MGSFEELLESAGFLRDDSAVGTIFESDRPAAEDVDRMYDEVAEEADVDPDVLLLEFAPVSPERGRARINVALWYDGELTSRERNRIVDALRRRFGVERPKPPSSRKTKTKAKAKPARPAAKKKKLARQAS